ncbi:MAG: asparagine synthase (glutamine-hydrolyzing) [Bryobacterales bacterium]|nr:asparagine synthase (glutamine-hydrolyzing) [Bryobacteraceae bacterium]MDW8355423.1 asparagine synthase (glutamine-hydrolyzing) [Bryobacterales bacterium]
MCGIAGLLGSVEPLVARGAVRRMACAQAHRGPDDEGLELRQFGSHTLALGHRRLAILDLSPLGHQPMENPDTGDLVVYNGEIYNFWDLRTALEQAGYRFRSRCDTEVLLRAYEHWGTQCLDKFRGMFAFALWDARRRQLFLARDHLGIKPLYCAARRECFLFGSELRALLASGLIPPEVDPRGLASYLAYGAVQEPLTIVEGVRMLPAGSWMVTDLAGNVIRQKRYWSFPAPDPARRHLPRATLVEEGRALLERSVHRHMISDVPVGVFLSSGLDSTAVLGLAAHGAGEQIHAFTVSFPEDRFQDEAAVARQTAARLGVTHHVCTVDSASALEWATDAIRHLDQPTVDGVNAYMVSRAVRREGIVVALSGQGGDEIFGGYWTFDGVRRWVRRRRWLRWMPERARIGLVELAGLRRPSLIREKGRDLARGDGGILSIYFSYQRLLPDRDMERLGFRAEPLGLTPSFHDPEIDGADCIVEGDVIASVSRLEARFYLGSTLLRDGDVFGMANSLEIRVPLLDRDVAEWAFRMPGDVLLPNGVADKFWLRQICREFYSEEQLRRAKRGFAAPFSVWIRGPLEEPVREGLQTVKHSGLVEPAGVEHIWRRFLEESQNFAWTPVWALNTLGHWLARTRQVCLTPTAA